MSELKRINKLRIYKL